MNKKKKECVAMILAGGQGKRLGVLTDRLAKPAVPFGGKYRIIDFPLSNCHNSGIDTVGVLTQYQPFALHSYLGTGSSWDLDRRGGGVYLLPPFERARGAEWYKGTANAIHQNSDFINLYDPHFVLILSGDHIYKMNYSKMLQYHQEHEAEVTIAVLEVPWAEASRFGIMNTDKQNNIVEFEEKPKKPKSNLASMGVYIFNWNILKKYLEQDEADSKSAHDFGKNIIPTMLKDGCRMVAYPYSGYWKDVGTVESLWEANMDLMEDNAPFNLHDESWKIYSVNPTRPPHFIGASGVVRRSLVSEGCEIYGQVEHSVLFPGVYVGEGAFIKDSVLFPGARVGAGCRVERAVVSQKAVLEEGVQLGAAGEDKITVVGSSVVVKARTVIASGTVVEE